MARRRTVFAVTTLVFLLCLAAGAVLRPSAPGPIVRRVALPPLHILSVSISVAFRSGSEIFQQQHMAVNAHAGRVYVAPTSIFVDYRTTAVAGDAAVLTFNTASGGLLHRTRLHRAVAALVPDLLVGRLLTLQDGLSAIGVLGADDGSVLGAIPLE